MSNLSSIAEKVHRNERLSFEDGGVISKSGCDDACPLRKRSARALNSNVAYYNQPAHQLHQHLCHRLPVPGRLCAKPGEAGGYAMRLEEVFKFAKRNTRFGNEFHIVGGLIPACPLATTSIS
jgi:hypothetical protein